MNTDFRGEGGAATETPDVELALTVVRYSDGPDRCTVYPPALSGDERLTRWLSADADAFVDLASAR